MKRLTIIVPAYNEEAVLRSSADRLLEIENQLISTQQISADSNLIIVDDGSTDKTWAIISQLHQENAQIFGLQFSRNFGHQAALIAGLSEAVKFTDLTVTIDADLQDDPDKIMEMVAKANAGYDVVYGVRNNRQSDSWFKRNSAEAYYRFLRLLGVDLVPDHADFRLLSKRAVQTFLQYQERNVFIRGIIPKLGYPSTRVYYQRTPRLAGESKYPLKKMLAFGWDGLTSFTVAPVRLILVLGIMASTLAVIMLIYSIIIKARGDSRSGWSSLMISVWFLGGIQMISLGVIGEYIGKITTEVKHRPRYTIETILD